MKKRKSPKRKRPTQQKSSPRGKGWKKRKRKRGQEARDLLKKIRSKRKVSDVQTALQLLNDDDMSEMEFRNFVMSLGFSNTEAYTFFVSPP